MSVEESVLADLEKKLANNLFVKGAQPSHEDGEAFEKFIKAKFVPDQDKYPSVWAWYSLMVLFEDEVIKSWKAPAKPEHKKEGKGEEKKEKEKKKKKKKGEKKKKKKEVDKSHVILEVKGWEADQDLEALAKKIISTIKKDGLSWNTGYKFEEVAFGVKKLVIAFLAEDDKCSVQEIVDELETWENDIQSVEVVSFNKA